jgi:hypothetical protein
MKRFGILVIVSSTFVFGLGVTRAQSVDALTVASGTSVSKSTPSWTRTEYGEEFIRTEDMGSHHRLRLAGRGHLRTLTPEPLTSRALSQSNWSSGTAMASHVRYSAIQPALSPSRAMASTADHAERDFSPA